MGTMPLDPLYKIGVLDGKKHERTRVLAVIAELRKKWERIECVDGGVEALDELRAKLEGNDGK